jgi:DMSO/TMAO reductase YedYZ molybdopterin-dependent catalytic subunit
VRRERIPNTIDVGDRPCRTPIGAVGQSVLARRDFLVGGGLALLGAAVAASPALFWPDSTAKTMLRLVGRRWDADRPDGLILLNDAPLRAETPLHQLDAAVTPVPVHFFQGDPPAGLDMRRAWTLSVDGLVTRRVSLEAGAVPTAFPVVTRPLLLECATNGAAAFCRHPATAGPAFTAGAVGNALWTGVRLRDVLAAAGLRGTAAGVVAEGLDGTVGPVLPMAKALDDGTLLAFAMGGDALLPHHGAPLRLVVPGWPEAYSRKWVTRLRAVADPGAVAALSVKSLITAPTDGAITAREVAVRGAAWSGDRTIRRVEVSGDFGRTWQAAALGAAMPHSWTRWQARVRFAAPGYAEIWARATDSAGAVQTPAPDAVSGRNAAIHRVRVEAA